MTGQIVADFFTDSDVYMMNSRCHMSCATANYLITSRTGAELVSLKEKKWHLHHWLRGACLYGLMPANGMLYAPPNPCACYTQSGLDGFNAVTGHDAGWQRLVERQKSPGLRPGKIVSRMSKLKQPTNPNRTHGRSTATTTSEAARPRRKSRCPWPSNGGRKDMTT